MRDVETHCEVIQYILGHRISGGIEQLKELKRLQKENERLRRAVSDLTLDSADVRQSLLKAFWYFDKNECDTDRPHRCNAAALSDEALEGIMGAVWEGE